MTWPEPKCLEWPSGLANQEADTRREFPVQEGGVYGFIQEWEGNMKIPSQFWCKAKGLTPMQSHPFSSAQKGRDEKLHTGYNIIEIATGNFFLWYLGNEPTSSSNQSIHMALNIVNKYVTVRKPNIDLCHFSNAIGIPLEHWYFGICWHEWKNLEKDISDQNIEICNLKKTLDPSSSWEVQLPTILGF